MLSFGLSLAYFTSSANAKGVSFSFQKLEVQVSTTGGNYSANDSSISLANKAVGNNIVDSVKVKLSSDSSATGYIRAKVYYSATNAEAISINTAIALNSLLPTATATGSGYAWKLSTDGYYYLVTSGSELKVADNTTGYTLFNSVIKVPDLAQAFNKMAVDTSNVALNVVAEAIQSENLTNKDGTKVNTVEGLTNLITEAKIFTNVTNAGYIVNFDSKGGATIPSQAVTSETITLPQVSGTNVTWYSDTALKNSVGTSGSNYSVTKNVTLYAKYTANSIIVFFDSDGATSGTTTLNSQSLNTTSNTTQTINVPQNLVKEGYEYNGKFIATANGVSTTLTATNGKISFTISNNQLNLESQTLTAGQAFTIKPNWIPKSTEGSAGTKKYLTDAQIYMRKTDNDDWVEVGELAFSINYGESLPQHMVTYNGEVIKSYNYYFIKGAEDSSYTFHVIGRNEYLGERSVLVQILPADIEGEINLSNAYAPVVGSVPILNSTLTTVKDEKVALYYYLTKQTVVDSYSSTTYLVGTNVNGKILDTEGSYCYERNAGTVIEMDGRLVPVSNSKYCRIKYPDFQNFSSILPVLSKSGNYTLFIMAKADNHKWKKCYINLYVNISGSSSSSTMVNYVGENGNIIQSLAYGSGSAVNVSKSVVSPPPTKTGWNFIGWNTTSTATTALGSYTMPAYNVNLYAIFSKTVKANFNANAGSASVSGMPSVQSGNAIYNSYGMEFPASINIPNATPSRSGYNFKGWADSSGATSATYSAGQAIELSGDKTLYAVWQNANDLYISLTDTTTYYYLNGSLYTYLGNITEYKCSDCGVSYTDEYAFLMSTCSKKRSTGFHEKTSSVMYVCSNCGDMDSTSTAHYHPSDTECSRCEGYGKLYSNCNITTNITSSEHVACTSHKATSTWLNRQGMERPGMITVMGACIYCDAIGGAAFPIETIEQNGKPDTVTWSNEIVNCKYCKQNYSNVSSSECPKRESSTYYSCSRCGKIWGTDPGKVKCYSSGRMCTSCKGTGSKGRSYSRTAYYKCKHCNEYINNSWYGIPNPAYAKCYAAEIEAAHGIEDEVTATKYRYVGVYGDDVSKLMDMSSKLSSSDSVYYWSDEYGAIKVGSEITSSNGGQYIIKSITGNQVYARRKNT